MPEDEPSAHSRGGSELKMRGTDAQRKGQNSSRGQSEIAQDRFSEVRQTLQSRISKVNPRVTQKVEEALPDDLNGVTAQEASGLAYKTMNPVIYNVTALVLYVIEVILGITISNIGMVFGFIGTFAGTGLSYFLPSLFVIIGFKKFATQQ